MASHLKRSYDQLLTTRYAASWYEKAVLSGWKPQPRHEKLKDLQTTIKLQKMVNLDIVPDLVKMLLQANELDTSEVLRAGMVGNKKLGKWLQQAHVPEAMITQAFRAIGAELELKISTRFKDIVNAVVSPHFNSCLGGFHSDQLKVYLEDPSLAVLLSYDSKGRVYSRNWIRLVRVTGIGYRVSSRYTDASTPKDHWPFGVYVYNQYGGGDNGMIDLNPVISYLHRRAVHMIDGTGSTLKTPRHYIKYDLLYPEITVGKYIHEDRSFSSTNNDAQVLYPAELMSALVD